MPSLWQNAEHITVCMPRSLNKGRGRNGGDMKRAAIFMADGCEEIEGLTVVDILRRAGIEIDMVSIGKDEKINGSHGIVFLADALISCFKPGDYDAFIIPGGKKGTENLLASEAVKSILKTAFEEGKLVAAVCAAPTVLGAAGILKEKKATCYPGFEDRLDCKTFSEERVVVDGNVITSRGMGTSIEFALAIVRYLEGAEKADTISKGIIFR